MQGKKTAVSIPLRAAYGADDRKSFTCNNYISQISFNHCASIFWSLHFSTFGLTGSHHIDQESVVQTIKYHSIIAFHQIEWSTWQLLLELTTQKHIKIYCRAKWLVYTWECTKPFPSSSGCFEQHNHPCSQYRVAPFVVAMFGFMALPLAASYSHVGGRRAESAPLYWLLAI